MLSYTFFQTQHSHCYYCTRAFCKIGHFHLMSILQKKTKNDKVFCVNTVTFLHNLAGSLFNTRQDILKKMFVKWGTGRKVSKKLHIFILFWLNVFLTITKRLKLKVSDIKNTMTILLTALNAFDQKKAASLLKMGTTFMKLLVAESVEIQCTNVNDLRHLLPRKEYQLLNFYINSGEEICRIHYLETQPHLVKQWNWYCCCFWFAEMQTFFHHII